MTTTPTDHAALRAHAEKATPGPWMNESHEGDRTVLALLDRLAAAEAVVEAARGVSDPGMERLRAPIEAYDRAIAGQQQEGT